MLKGFYKTLSEQIQEKSSIFLSALTSF